ncbi:hypothetical protein [Phaeovulum vinaykumarii]|uniref:hypothetical protein n=1 Tax=Phaeovulum vinaykumarii TaxID=407234 RepID=UPI000C7B127E|nr:hypothetical protein [Phaeovulum vinaykumarii]
MIAKLSQDTAIRDIAALLDLELLRKGEGGYPINWRVPQITRRWEDSAKLVFLDFHEDHLWCVPPMTNVWRKYATKIPKDEFVSALTEGSLPTSIFCYEHPGSAP